MMPSSGAVGKHECERPFRQVIYTACYWMNQMLKARQVRVPPYKIVNMDQ